MRAAPLLLALAAALAACGADRPAPPAGSPPPATFAAGGAASVTVPAGLAVPDGLAYVPGGAVTVGVLPGEGGMPHERPAFRADVGPFLLDRSPVTVDRFRAFVEATSYETQAEAFGDGLVMDPQTGRWALVPEASWRSPFGAGRPAPPGDHPVTQVSWADADTFCAWDGGRLPTEVEWEHAARGATDDRSPYAWGDVLGEGDPATGGADGTPAAGANTWTGAFPGDDDGSDGYAGQTSPVGAFGATDLGLTDLGGNVWEWTASWYRPYPLGPDGGAEPGVPAGPTGEPERAQRGGSFLCHPSYCHGYRVSARSHATAETAAAHTGFRCARDVPHPHAP